MSWPTPQDFNEAVQNPATNFSDEELRSGKVALNSLGLPGVATGAFASVYKIHCQSRNVAVRCFLREIPDLQNRYKRISDFVMSDDLPSTVGFQYLEQGINIRSRWIPILKMDWVEGKTLDSFIRQNLTNAPALSRLIQKLTVLAQDLKRAGIAHGDLQHGNILVTPNGELHLVDYDGMFVPGLKGERSLELGHRNYQHPARDGTHFDDRLDTFSIWCIVLSLGCLIRDCTLVQQLNGLDECIIFRQPDFRYPLKSATFALLESHNDPVIIEYAQKLRSLLSREPSMVPWIDEDFAVPEDLPALDYDRHEKPFESHIPTRAANPPQVENADESSDWPNLKDYINAVMRPSKAFEDPELKNSVLVLDHGNINPLSSDHGAVFKFQGQQQQLIAVKVFLKADEHLEERYSALKSLLEDSKQVAKSFVDFEYLSAGIQIGSAYYPCVKMPWVDGPTLFQLCESARSSRKLMHSLADKFRETVRSLNDVGIVHGDLEPMNLLYTEDRFVLVDYDLTIVPSSSEIASAMKSNKHFRHPKVQLSRDSRSDNFAAWLIYTSLIALSYEPSLWNRLSVAPGRLLFERRDLKQPANSLAFDLLRHHYANSVNQLAKNVFQFCSMPPEEIPKLPPFLLDRPEEKVVVARTVPALMPPEKHEMTTRQLTTVMVIGTTLTILGYLASPMCGTIFVSAMVPAFICWVWAVLNDALKWVTNALNDLVYPRKP